jgi:hypothetical protein
MLDNAGASLPPEYTHFASLVRRGENIGPAIDELYDVWERRYVETIGSADLSILDVDDGEVLFDLARKPDAANGPRTVGAAAFLHKPPGPRDKGRQASFPMRTTRFGRTIDRGHLLPHSGGGQLGPNVFAQDANLNRGLSLDGRRYRHIEAHAAAQKSFFFCALAYCDDTDFPAVVDLGTVDHGVVRIHSFRNRFDPTALAKFPLPTSRTEALRAVMASMNTSQFGAIGEMCAAEYLEAEFDAVPTQIGDSTAERTSGMQSLDMSVLLGGGFFAVEVKSRLIGLTAGRRTHDGDLPKPVMSRPRAALRGRAANRQGTPGYAAERLDGVLPRPHDGTVDTLAVAVDLKLMLAQTFAVDDRGHVGKPLAPPADCTEAAIAALRTALAFPIRL